LPKLCRPDAEASERKGVARDSQLAGSFDGKLTLTAKRSKSNEGLRPRLSEFIVLFKKPGPQNIVASLSEVAFREVISERDWQWCRFRKFFETTISARGWGGKIIRRVCHD